MKANNLALRTELMVLDYPHRALWLCLGLLGACMGILTWRRRQGGR